MNCTAQNVTVIISGFIGVIGVLLGVLITQLFENKRHIKEQIDKAKPIIINYGFSQATQETTQTIWLETKGQVVDTLVGIFKNTGNGILFIDRLETAKYQYFPKQSTAVDKNTKFTLMLDVISGENLQKCTIYCHDIYCKKYYFNAHFCDIGDTGSQITIENSMPIAVD